MDRFEDTTTHNTLTAPLFEGSTRGDGLQALGVEPVRGPTTASKAVLKQQPVLKPRAAQVLRTQQGAPMQQLSFRFSRI
jgi:hypothetical protein